MRKILTLILIIISLQIYSQERLFYHQFEPTASDFKVVKWNIKKDSLPPHYFTEKIDSDNRVTELKFYKDGKNNFDHLCYLITWIKFEYPNAETIIQLNLNDKGIPEANFECGLPSRTTYYLSKDQREIIKSEDEFKFNYTPYLKNNWTKKEIEKVINELKSEEETASIVNYYSKSFYKLNNIFPVDNEFDITIFYFSDLEKENVINGLK
ncbi:hypothetical protein [Zunongwangia sp. H14]|uniref:hypothetical protein n=1 Tax=Zunongwangia sp. H14 TaxID=3240792 RepID=UPI003564B883